MRGRPVLVTGANGFLGRHVAAGLEAVGHEVVRAVRTNPGPGEVRAPDLGPDAAWEHLLEDAGTVVHLAGIAHRHDVPEAEIRRANEAGTARLAAAAARCGVDRFVFMSTIGVAGGTSTDIVTEDTPPAPASPYAAAKLAAEEALAATSGLQTVVLRPPLVLGPDAPGNVARLLRLVRRRIPIPIGACDGRRSFVFVANLVDATTACVRDPRAADQTFVVADGTDLTSPELVRRLAGFAGLRPLVFPLPQQVLRLLARLAGREADIARLSEPMLVDPAKLRQRLGWSPPVTVDEGLRQTAAAIRAHDNG